MSPQDLKVNVEEWLRTLGSTPVPQDDAETNWHFMVDYPARTAHRMHVVNPKASPRAVVIASANEVSPEHIQGFEQLDDDGKDVFLWELRHTLNQLEIDFQMEGVKEILDCPTRFQVSMTRYNDGLTLDSFARSVGKIYHAELSAVWVIQRHLGQKGYGSGGRFDFKKLGF